jgi:hypothetical protein
MSSAIKIAFVLFAFGFVVGAFNGLEVYNTQLPNTELTLDEQDVIDITAGVQDAGNNPLAIPGVTFQLINVLVQGLLSALAFIVIYCDYLTQAGVSLEIATLTGMIFQGPIWFSYIAALFELVTGRPLL